MIALSIVLFCVSVALIVFVVLYARSQKSLNVFKSRDAEWENLYQESQRMMKVYETTIDNYENMIVEISDELPKKHDARAYAMKLSNELAPYFIVDEDKVSIKVYKGTSI